MDQFTKGVLVVIAVALCAIAVRLWAPPYATFGEFAALQGIADTEARKAATARAVARVPVIRIQGGAINADVSGSVSIER